MSDQTLTDVVLAVDALIDEFGWEAFANEIPVWEAEERRADGKIKRFHHQRERIFRAALDDERLRNLEGDPPKPAWEPGGGRVATKDGSTFVECWLPPKIRDDNEPAAPGLIPIPKTMTHRERGVLLAAVHYRYAVGADCVIDPERVSFLDGRSPGFGPFGILVAMVESLTDADAPILMTMVEKVRKEFAERSGGKQEKPKGTAGPVLSDRQYRALQVLLEQNAFSPDKRCTRQVVAEKAEGKHATANTYAKHIASLVMEGFAASKAGPNGGIWLTEDGRKLAEQLDKNR